MQPPAIDGQLNDLVQIMAQLLGPNGCPWDRKQTLESLRPYLIEETYEVIDALQEGDRDNHREELGDLLFQIVFQAALARFSMAEIISGIAHKLIRRHPHVFGDVQAHSPEQVRANWEAIKRAEKQQGDETSAGGTVRGVLDGVPRSMPALPRAMALSQRAAKVGFDWPDAPSARAKVLEEIEELDQAASAARDDQMQHELGDLLFAALNWGRKLGLDPEVALDGANRRFIQRFGSMEQALRQQQRRAEECTLDQLEALWQRAKRQQAEGE